MRTLKILSVGNVMRKDEDLYDLEHGYPASSYGEFAGEQALEVNFEVNNAVESGADRGEQIRTNLQNYR